MNEQKQIFEELIAKRNKFEEIVKNEQFLYDEFIVAAGEEGLKSANAIRENYMKNVDSQRDLQIGIVGRVKAGKSSLLNSLIFDGQNILPKAATPMTAALTTLYYNENITVKINFFDTEDIKTRDIVKCCG